MLPNYNLMARGRGGMGGGDICSSVTATCTKVGECNDPKIWFTAAREGRKEGRGLVLFSVRSLYYNRIL